MDFELRGGCERRDATALEIFLLVSIGKRSEIVEMTIKNRRSDFHTSHGVCEGNAVQNESRPKGHPFFSGEQPALKLAVMTISKGRKLAHTLP